LRSAAPPEALSVKALAAAVRLRKTRNFIDLGLDVRPDA
jgi:hypothetical protein